MAAKTAAIETAAIGFSPHSGWAAMVVLGGTAAAPTLLARSRVILIDEQDPKSKQPYHAVESMNIEAAAARLDEYMAVSARLALASIQSESEKLKGLGHRLGAVGILDSSGRKHVGLSSILASHALIHGADGDHFRNALSSAAEQLGLRVCRVPARSVEPHAAEHLKQPIDRLLATVNQLGRGAGPPWGADQKKAALLTWTLL
jgi:hypothetical protein